MLAVRKRGHAMGFENRQKGESVKLSMTIEYEVSDVTHEVELVAGLIGDEARAFIDSLRRQLEDAGVDDVEVTVKESV